MCFFNLPKHCTTALLSTALLTLAPVISLAQTTEERGLAIATEADTRDLGYIDTCLLYTSPSPRDKRQSRMPSSA